MRVSERSSPLALAPRRVVAGCPGTGSPILKPCHFDSVRAMPSSPQRPEQATSVERTGAGSSLHLLLLVHIHSSGHVQTRDKAEGVRARPTNGYTSAHTAESQRARQQQGQQILRDYLYGLVKKLTTQTGPTVPSPSAVKVKAQDVAERSVSAAKVSGGV